MIAFPGPEKKNAPITGGKCEGAVVRWSAGSVAPNPNCTIPLIFKTQLINISVSQAWKEVSPERPRLSPGGMCGEVGVGGAAPPSPHTYSVGKKKTLSAASLMKEITRAVGMIITICQTV